MEAVASYESAEGDHPAAKRCPPGEILPFSFACRDAMSCTEAANNIKVDVATLTRHLLTTDPKSHLSSGAGCSPRIIFRSLWIGRRRFPDHIGFR